MDAKATADFRQIQKVCMKLSNYADSNITSDGRVLELENLGEVTKDILKTMVDQCNRCCLMKNKIRVIYKQIFIGIHKYILGG